MSDRSSLEPWIDAGLFDPDADRADEIGEVLEFYDSLGVDPADYKGVDPADLMSKVNLRILQPGPRLTAAETRHAAGISAASFELARVRVRIEELLQYTEGSLIRTDRVSGEPVVLLVGGEPFATGEVVTISEKFGMRVEELTKG